MPSVRYNRRLFRAKSVKYSPQAVEAVQSVFDEESVKLRKVTNGSVTVTYQYLSQSFVDAAHTADNAIDLDPADEPFIGMPALVPFSPAWVARYLLRLDEYLAILLAAAWTSASDDAYLLDFLVSLVQGIDSVSKAAGLYYPFIFCRFNCTDAAIACPG